MNADCAYLPPNPARAIWVRGRLDQALLDRLQPEILALTSRGRDPITVFIDSAGGFSDVRERIMELLRSRANGEEPCPIITVALSRASSAAATLLTQGNFAVASRDSALLYHGTGYLDGIPRVTAEVASEMKSVIGYWNERNIASLYRAHPRRFMFILSGLRASLESHRSAAKNPALTDLECFEALLLGKLTFSGQRLLERAAAHRRRCDELLARFRRDRRRLARRNLTSTEDRILEAAISLERESRVKDPKRNLRAGGLSRINEDCFLLWAYFRCLFSAQCERLPPSLDDAFAGLDYEARAAVERAADARLAPVIPFLSFFVAICYALNEGENCLSGTDAFFLGLIDAAWEKDRLAQYCCPTELQHAP